MSAGPWHLFPYPTLTSAAELVDGSLMGSHPTCTACPTRECLASLNVNRSDPQYCRFGITFARVDEVRLVVGVLVNDVPNATQRSRRRAKSEPERRVSSKNLKHAIYSARELGLGVVSDFEIAKAELLEKLSSDPQLQEALAENLRRDFSESLQQSHDFLQLVKLVRGHAEALLLDKYPALDPSEAADKLPTEGAIYYSTELMLAKMDSLAFLNEINLALGSERKFKIHPLVLKYVRIYDWQARQKDLKVRLEGEAYGSSRYNDRAIGAVVQGLLDNMVKYAPAGSAATVTFTENATLVKLAFSSLGPKIEPDERSSIFLPKCRGRAAMAMEMSGLGIGLATAKRISDALGLELALEQETDPDARFVGVYRTTFSFHLDKDQKVVG